MQYTKHGKEDYIGNQIPGDGVPSELESEKAMILLRGTIKFYVENKVLSSGPFPNEGEEKVCYILFTFIPPVRGYWSAAFLTLFSIVLEIYRLFALGFLCLGNLFFF